MKKDGLALCPFAKQRYNSKAMKVDYAKLLNQNQLEAVETRNQYVRIVAGAGSGKTRVLTYRIAYLIEEMGVDPSRILAVTFTNKAAKEMKDRVARLVPKAALYLHVSTFHSFCARFLREEAHQIGYPIGFTIFDEDDVKSLIRRIAEERGLKKSDPLVKLSIKYIDSKKTRGLYPEDITLNYESFEHEKDCLEFYTRYEELKREMFAFDFDDLLIVTLKILKAIPEVLEAWKKRFAHILIDEYQDTNDIQAELIRRLMNPETSLYVVGDPDQTIYTWRGANQKIIMDFPNYFRGCKDIILDQNYRSTGNILDAANKLISRNSHRVKKNLYTLSPSGSSITAKRFESRYDEARYVINEIMSIYHRERTYGEIALLYRSSFVTEPFEKALAAKGIPYRIFGGLRFYQRREVKDVIAYFNLLLNPLDDVAFERIINAPTRGIGDVTLAKIRNGARDNKISEYQFVSNIDQYPGYGIPSKAVSALTMLVVKMEETKERLTENLESYAAVLRDFITDIGYMTYIAEDQEPDEDRVANVNALFDDINNFIKDNPESTFSNYLQNISLLTAQDDMNLNNGDYVSLMTVHCAKGLEFDYVFIVGLNQGSFPSARASAERPDDGEEEERRIAYVAMTRAKKCLYMTCNSSYTYVSDTHSVPSQFFKEAGLSIPDDSRRNTYGGYNNPRSSGSSWSRLWQDSSSDDVIFDDGEPLMPFEEKKPTPPPVKKPISNGITDWKVGDIAMHEKFGRGVVIQVIDSGTIVVAFDTAGKKTLVSTHPMLSKGFKGGQA